MHADGLCDGEGIGTYQKKSKTAIRNMAADSDEKHIDI